MHINKHRASHPPFLPQKTTSVPSNRAFFESQRLPREFPFQVTPGYSKTRFSQSQPHFCPMPGIDFSKPIDTIPLKQMMCDAAF